MAMIVQHNMTAMNANRMLGVTVGQQAKSTEKLSSGYKINRAADDAAGLSISEKMRKQIRGLSQASSNAQDGISAVQTAEGALTEVHSMLQRMNELATQAANGTNSDTDRQSIQDEIDQLTTEIDRVAETTKFNETYLLKGNAEGTSSDRYVNAHDAGLAGKLTDNGDGTATFKLDKALADGDKVKIAGVEYTIGSKTAGTDGFKKSTDLDKMKLSAGDSVTTAAGVTKTLVNKVANAQAIYNAGDKIEIDGETYTIATGTNLSGKALSTADAVKMVDDALAAGKTAKHLTSNAGAGMFAAGATEVEIVSSLATGEESTLEITTTPAKKGFVTAKDLNGGDLGSGDVVTVGGEKITATTNEPVNMSTIKDVVKQLQNGDVIDIGTKEFTIADKTDVGANKLTVNDALALLNDRDNVKIKTASSTEAKNALNAAGLKEGTVYTAVETKTVSDDENVLSDKDAYAKMAEELEKASSIGTDTNATVKSNNSGEFTITKGTVNVKDSLSFALHVGADADMTNKITVKFDSMSAAGLGVKGLSILDDTGAKATYAVDAVADAISKVSAQRSALGAVQNRLEHTIANLDNVVENTTSAESAIRDTDMATEMVNYSKNNILAQAGQSMLAQANQSNQGVLSLLG